MAMTVAEVVAFPRPMFLSQPAPTAGPCIPHGVHVVDLKSLLSRSQRSYAYDLRNLFDPSKCDSTGMLPGQLREVLGAGDRPPSRHQWIAQHINGISQVQALRAGWFNGLGSPLPPATATTARLLLSELDDLTLSKMSVFPRPRGGLTFEWVSALGYDATLDIVERNRIEAHASADGLETKFTIFTGIEATVRSSAAAWAKTLDGTR